MIKIKLITFFLLLLLSQLATAQLLDSLRFCIKQKPKFSIKIDSRNSFISSQRAPIFSLKLGVEFNNILRIGGGYNTLKAALSTPHFIKDSVGKVVDTVSAHLKLDYLSYYIEYAFYQTKRWEMAIPMQIGIGYSYYDYKLGDKKSSFSKQTIVVYETNLVGHYKIFSWVGVGVGIGYRVMLLGNKKLEENFNSPIYVFKIKFFLVDAYKAMFSKSSK